MEAAQRSRLRLSRRRPPSRGGPPSSRPGSLQAGDGESAQLWAELQRVVSADGNLDGELPPLPAFPGQEPRNSPQRAASPEVFTVGPETFYWTPFPPAPRGGWDPSRSYQVHYGSGEHPGSRARSLQGACAPDSHGIPCTQEHPPTPDPHGIPSTQEQPPAEGTQSLRSCPMCQADFAPGLAQLDIDSHLAQCLADSTEDMVW
ncbi:Fanconi anemia core complex-associated protein 20 [Rousettus aegyptiacus]|uniref:FA core complex associated protein 20 n=3 Tax=Rousettus aegyptiacus TaxID=9407 RepID=A0A7J8K8A7_ROUAE|nr:Fanconi anemia core complex-associated protein 20 [Rousettus aegyptiacus]KAF6505041.1 FA core complex associated protein 20 [Rousettus aegyptiacus]